MPICARHRGCKKVYTGLHLPSAGEIARQVEGQEVDAIEGRTVNFTFGKSIVDVCRCTGTSGGQAGGNSRFRKQLTVCGITDLDCYLKHPCSFWFIPPRLTRMFKPLLV